MNSGVKIARNVIEELDGVAVGNPALESQYGSLFVSETVPAACIKLKVPREEYFQFLLNLSGSELAEAFKLIPVDRERFDIAVNGRVVVNDGIVTLDGKRATIL